MMARNWSIEEFDPAVDFPVGMPDHEEESAS